MTNELIPDERAELESLRAFFQRVVAVSRDALVDGRELSGADLVANIAAVITDHLVQTGTPLFVAIGDPAQPGYWNNGEGWVSDADYMHVSADTVDLGGLVELIAVIAVPPDKVGQIDSMPDLDSIEDMAQQVLDEAAKEGVELDAAKAGERMRGAYDAQAGAEDVYYVPDALAKAMGEFVVRYRDQVHSRERG